MSSLADRIFPLINDAALGRRMKALRARAVEGLAGRVIEVGAGSGLNFAHYGRGADVVAVEPSLPMLKRAEDRRAKSSARITLVEGKARTLPFDDASFDAAVITFTLCSIRDVPAALAELSRVLRPGAEVRLLEHVVSEGTRRVKVQRALEPLWGIAFGGCSLLRDARGDLEAAGFTVATLERIALPLPFPVGEGVVGRAIAPSISGSGAGA